MEEANLVDLASRKPSNQTIQRRNSWADDSIELSALDLVFDSAKPRTSQGGT